MIQSVEVQFHAFLPRQYVYVYSKLSVSTALLQVAIG
jgi:hypothetical protein